MAHNHRGQRIADPYLNSRREMLEGLAYNPEDTDYDEAYGPADRTRRMRAGVTGSGGSTGPALNRQDVDDEKMESRRMEGY